MAIKNYYCVVDKQYTNGKKNEEPPRFISIQTKEHPSKPKDSVTRVEHADIKYTWFDDAASARKYKAELLQEE